jgi:hypothetical protein
MKQKDLELGCIPTNISATLEALGIRGVTEQQLLKAYLSTICFSNIERLGVLSKFTIDGRPLSNLLNLEVHDSSSFEDWSTRVSDWLRSHRFVLFAFKINGNSHIRTAVKFDPVSNTLETYDPNPHRPANAIPMTREELAAMWSSGKLNHDLLSICRR